MVEKIKIDGEFITLGQLLKMVDLIDSGGQAKFFLKENEVLVNGELDDRRGRKLFPNDEITIFNKQYRITL